MSHLPQLSTTNFTDDLPGILIYMNSVTGDLFSPLMVFAFFMIVMLATFFSTSRLQGRGDFLVSFTAAGFFTTGLCIIMMLRDGLLNPAVTLIVIALTILGVIGLYLLPKADN